MVNGFEDGKWREDLFRQFVMNNIAQTGLSADERENICTIDLYTQITRSIMNLRLVDCENGQGSEIAEIVLYGIMRYHYNALPVVPKIFYKQILMITQKEPIAYILLLMKIKWILRCGLVKPNSLMIS